MEDHEIDAAGDAEATGIQPAAVREASAEGAEVQHDEPPATGAQPAGVPAADAETAGVQVEPQRDSVHAGAASEPGGRDDRGTAGVLLRAVLLLGGLAAVLLRAVLLLGGLAAVGYGVHGALGAHRLTNPSYAARWLAGGILVHDFLLVPATALVGIALTRVVHRPYRAVVQGALIVSGSLALATLPLWRGYGRNPGNPSVDPLPYGRNLGIVLAAVWFVAAVVIVVRWRRQR
jgi:hypothetical protein